MKVVNELGHGVLFNKGWLVRVVVVDYPGFFRVAKCAKASRSRWHCCGVCVLGTVALHSKYGFRGNCEGWVFVGI
ncbi:hypothetical protein [Bartonella sp. CB178]|uniref:hypothetical protein n=1 Tax=Bartonella sp. CB178 TaxID=3112255 RepID=UPI00300E644E